MTDAQGAHMNDDAVAGAGLTEALLALGERDGVVPISELPGLYHRKVDARWEIWVNPHLREMVVPGQPKHTLEPAELYVEFNGWPWGSIDLATGDAVLGDGEAANLTALIAALREAGR